MIRDDRIYEFEFDCDRDWLRDEGYDEAGYVPYEDARYPGMLKDDWMMKRMDKEEQSYSRILCGEVGKKIGSKDIRPRFYLHSAGADLGWHVDHNNKCSINVLLTTNEDVISFRDGDVGYSTALLNTTIEHAVFSPKHDRLLFKMSIFDLSYEEVRDLIAAGALD